MGAKPLKPPTLLALPCLVPCISLCCENQTVKLSTAGVTDSYLRVQLGWIGEVN